MTKEAYSKAFGLIKDLDAKEREQLKILLDERKQTKAKVEIDATSPEFINDWLLAGFISYWVNNGMISSKDVYTVVPRMISYKKQYLTQLPVVMSYLNTVEKQSKTKTRHRPKLAYVCAIALANLLRKWNIEVTVQTMLRHANKLEVALERAYPAYVQSGLFGVVVDALEMEN